MHYISKQLYYYTIVNEIKTVQRYTPSKLYYRKIWCHACDEMPKYSISNAIKPNSK